MNIKEARILVGRIICTGRPLAVYDGTDTGFPFGDKKKGPSDDDPARIVCRKLYSKQVSERCIYDSGISCPDGLVKRS